MEEKKSKFSLAVVLLILAVIVIIVMSLFMYKLYKDKDAEIGKVAELNGKIGSLNLEISRLQSQVNTLTQENTKNEKVDIDRDEKTDNISILSETEALTILKSKFDIIEKIYFAPAEFFNVNTGEEIKDFDKTILKYGTDNLLKEIKNNLPMCVRFENGKYYFLEGGGAREYVGLDSFENIEVTNSTITATLKTKQSIFNGTDWVSTNDKSSEFTLVKSGNEWLMDKFNSSDLD